MTKAEFTRLT